MMFTSIVSPLLTLLLLHAWPAAGETCDLQTHVLVKGYCLPLYHQQGRLISNALGSNFGAQVDLSADGKTMAVSSSYDDYVFVYVYDGKGWKQQAALAGNVKDGSLFGGGLFSNSLSLSADGNRLAVGAPDDLGGRGSVTVFKRDASGKWFMNGPKVRSPADAAKDSRSFGYAVALSGDGHTMAVGAVHDGKNGAFWAFNKAGRNWTVTGPKFLGSDLAGSDDANVGSALALSADGSTLAARGAYVGSSRTPATWVYVRSSKDAPYKQQGPTLFSYHRAYINADPNAIALSADGNTLVGLDNTQAVTGGASVYVRTGGTWKKQAFVLGSGAAGDVYAQSAVALSGDGRTLVLGGPMDTNKDYGCQWVFVLRNGEWLQVGPKLVGQPLSPGSNQGTGLALSADGRTLASGGTGYPNNSINGAVWVFQRNAK